MKAYTDISQSKKLAEILPLESADMYYYSYMSIGEPFYMSYPNVVEDRQKLAKNDIPAWSLSALLDLCPTINGKQPILTRGKLTSLWYCYYEDEIDTQTYDNPIDACYEMIIRLNELKIL